MIFHCFVYNKRCNEHCWDAPSDSVNETWYLFFSVGKHSK